MTHPIISSKHLINDEFRMRRAGDTRELQGISASSVWGKGHPSRCKVQRRCYGLSVLLCLDPHAEALTPNVLISGGGPLGGH